MGRVLEFLFFAAVFIAVIGAVSWVIARGMTASLRRELSQLRSMQARLETGESAQLKELRAELSDAKDDLYEYDQMSNDIMRQIAERPNPLDMSGPYQPIIDTIATQRPRRNKK